MAVKVLVPASTCWTVQVMVAGEYVELSGRWNLEGQFWAMSMLYNGITTQGKACGGSLYYDPIPIFAWYTQEPGGGKFFVRDTLARGEPMAVDSFSDGWELIHV